MRFEHIGPDGQCKCVDVHISCIDIEDCVSQAANGYKFKLDGKAIGITQIKQLVGYTGKPHTTVVTPADTSTRKVRPICCISNGKVYKNMSEAAKDLGIDSAMISYSLKVGRPTKGYEFKFADLEISGNTADARLPAGVSSHVEVADPDSNNTSSAKATGGNAASFAALAKQVKGR